MFVLMGFVVARWEVSRAGAGDVAMWVRAPTTRHRAVTPRPPDLFAEPVCVVRAARSVRSGQRTSLRGQGIIERRGVRCTKDNDGADVCSACTVACARLVNSLRWRVATDEGNGSAGAVVVY